MSSNLKQYRVGVQPIQRPWGDGGAATSNTGDYYETIVQATDPFRARQIAAAPHGGERLCEVRVFGEVR